jgi:hypothetical protein
MRTTLLASLLGLLMACSSPADSSRPGRDGVQPPDNIPDNTDDVDTAVPWPEDTENWEDDEPVDEGCQGPIGLNQGDCAPDFTMTSSRNTEVSLSQFSGKKVIVIGSATW